MTSTKWKPLAPRPIDWAMKPLESAETGVKTLADGRLELTIRHDKLKGVTPAMLGWWFRNIDGMMRYEGRMYPRYHVWHPVDHIHYELAGRATDGTAGPGSRFLIVEAFGANPKHLVNSVADVPRNDDTGITLSVRKFGMEVMRLEHNFTATPEGTLYQSTMHVGAKTLPARRMFNESCHGCLARPRAGRGSNIMSKKLATSSFSCPCSTSRVAQRRPFNRA